MIYRPWISTVVVNLGQDDLLEQAVCSVLDQDYPKLELILIDGQPTETSREVSRRYRHHLKEIRSNRLAGAGDALNHGLSRASGTVVTFLPADYLMLPGAVQDAVCCLGQTPRAAWLVGQTAVSPTASFLPQQPVTQAPRQLRDLLLDGATGLPLEGAFFHTAMLRRHRGFNAAMRHAWAYELACRLVAAGERPQVLAQALVAGRGMPAGCDLSALLAGWLEHIEIAEIHGPALDACDQAALEQSCQQQRQLWNQARRTVQMPSPEAEAWRNLLLHPRRLATEALQKKLLSPSSVLADEQAWLRAA